MPWFTKKKKIGLIAAALVLGVSGTAFAYWTAGGSGTGSAATGTNVAITAVQTSTVAAMAPGDAAQSLNGTFTNTNSGPVYVATVTAAIGTVTPGAGGTCEATDYTLANAVMTVNAEALANDTSTWTGATIKFNNKPGENQDDCKNATVQILYTIA